MLGKILCYKDNFRNFANYGIVLFSLLMPINEDFGRKVISLVAVFWIIGVDYKQVLDYIKNNKIFQLFLTFSILYCISILWSSDYHMAFKLVQVYIKYFFLPIFLFVTIAKYEYIKYFIYAFIVSMMINELMSYSIYFGFSDIFFGYKANGNSSNPIPFHAAHISYSLYIAFTILLSIFMVSHKNKQIFKIIASIFLITMTANLFLSSGRTGQLAFLLSSCFLIFIYYRSNLKYLFVSIVILFFTIFAAYNISDTFNQRVNSGIRDIKKIVQSENYNSSFGVRLASYTIIPEIFLKENMIIGTGIGDIQHVVNNITAKKYGENSIFAYQNGLLHNTFLEILVSLGVVGLIVFLCFLYLILISKHDNNFYKYISYLVVFSFVFSGISASFYSFYEIMLLFSLFVSIVIVSNHKKGSNL